MNNNQGFKRRWHRETRICAAWRAIFFGRAANRKIDCFSPLRGLRKLRVILHDFEKTQAAPKQLTDQASRRARSAVASVPSSSTSNAPPMGTPWARREIGMSDKNLIFSAR